MARGTFQRNTRQREVILDELRKTTSHPTASGLHEIVRQRLPKISLGTVYRNLQLLARMGLIQKLEFSGVQARFDGNCEGHDHVRCLCCGCVDDVDGPPLDLSGGRYDDCNGYQVLGHRLEYLGICPKCRPRRPTVGRPSPGRCGEQPRRGARGTGTVWFPPRNPAR